MRAPAVVELPAGTLMVARARSWVWARPEGVRPRVNVPGLVRYIVGVVGGSPGFHRKVKAQTRCCSCVRHLNLAMTLRAGSVDPLALVGHGI